ncbi:MAG: PIN domain-containing protein [Dehalococcoidia bacterium]
MNVRCLVDTNVLVYAVDPRSGAKSITANEILEGLASRRDAVTTAQVVSEFYSAVTRPREGSPLLQPAGAIAWLGDWIFLTVFIDLTLAIAEEAIRAAHLHRMNIYDAQMWAAAKIHAIPVLITEDLQSRPQIEGVRYVNPFAPSFAPAPIGL